MKSFKQFFSENIGGIFKDASEWEKSAKARGLVVKSMTHPSGEMTKYQIAKDKEGNNRGHFDHGTKSGHLKEEVELNENPWNQRLQKKPGTEELPAPSKGAVEKHGKKFKEGDMVVPHTGPHAGVPHKVTYARTGSVNILPMVSINQHKYNNTTIRAKHEHLSPYKPVKEEVELDESETKYVVKGKSPFYKQDHYINTHETPKAQLIKKHIKNATRMDLETAKKVAKDWESHPNKYKTEVVPVKEEVEQLDELSPKTLKSYSDKANKSLDRLAKQRDAVEKGMSKTYAAVGKRSAAEKAAHGATTQAQHNKATAAYRVADKSAEKNLAGHNDLAKQHSQLTKKINKRMDGMDRAYDKMHEEVELDEAKLERHTNTVGAHHLERDSGDHKMYTAYTGSLVRRLHTVADKDDNILGQATSAASAMAKAKLKKAHRDALMHDDNQIVKVHDTRGGHNVGTQVSTPGKGKWFKDHEEALKYAKSLPGKIRHADEKGHVY